MSVLLDDLLCEYRFPVVEARVERQIPPQHFPSNDCAKRLGRDEILDGRFSRAGRQGSRHHVEVGYHMNVRFSPLDLLLDDVADDLANVLPTGVVVYQDVHRLSQAGGLELLYAVPVLADEILQFARASG